MTYVLNQKNIGKFYICLSCSINYKGLEVFDVQVCEKLGDIYTTRKCNFYNDKEKAKRSYYNTCSIVKKYSN